MNGTMDSSKHKAISDESAIDYSTCWSNSNAVVWWLLCTYFNGSRFVASNDIGSKLLLLLIDA